MLMKILIIDEKKTRREELASINKEVNNILKNCDQLHILTGNECTSFIEEIRSQQRDIPYCEVCNHLLPPLICGKIEDQLKKDMPEKQYSTNFLFRTLFLLLHE